MKRKKIKIECPECKGTGQAESKGDTTVKPKQRLLVDLAKAFDKPDWWDTCTAYNDCSLCPYGVTETGKYYTCGVKNKEILEK